MLLMSPASLGLDIYLSLILHPAFHRILRNGQFRLGEELFPKLDLVSVSSNTSAVRAVGWSPVSMKLQFGCLMEQKQMEYQGFEGLRQAIVAASRWLCKNWL